MDNIFVSCFFHFMTHEFHHRIQLNSCNTLHAEQRMRMLVQLYNLMKEVTSGGHNYFVGFNLLMTITCQGDVAEVLSDFLKESA